MADETKRNPSDPQASGGDKPPAQPVTAAGQNVAPGKAGDAAQGKDPAKVQPTPPGAAAGHAAPPPKPAGPAATPWEHPRVAKLKGLYGSGIKDALTYLGQNYFVVNKEVVFDVLRSLRDDEKFDYCVDVTAVHYPDKPEPFEVVWILYSFAHNERVRVKTSVKDGEKPPSSVPLWETANWLEREVYDMFGVEFEGHPDMRRILLPDGWKGFPLRKDYGIIQQDNEWVKINLGIESGQ
ncbi:MAG TPA: NADH-quinone oxidoreductase subunit C [Terriglobales bacterium]|jgi:NADH-quinone oxidoreductase subunit C|nr:NADH-quinone oxidoreductase subunit C [Terriglobales bacterium]